MAAGEQPVTLVTENIGREVFGVAMSLVLFAERLIVAIEEHGADDPEARRCVRNAARYLQRLAHDAPSIDEETQMSRGYSHVTLVGNLGGDPEMRYTPNGAAVMNFSLAVNRRRRGKNGEQEDATDWYRVTLWGRQAETAADMLAKGARALVEGELRIEGYTDKQGVQRTAVEVNAANYLVLSSREQSGEGGVSWQQGGQARDSSWQDDVPF